MLKVFTQASLCALILAAAPVAHALAASGLPNATYQVSGTAGAYTLDFNVSNDLPAALNQNIYYFGIEPNVPITNSPSQWGPFDDANGHIPLQASSGIVYNTGWIVGPDNQFSIVPGTALSGFKATFASVPTFVNFYAFVYDTTNTNNKVGYEGIATPAAVPEASTIVGLGLLLALGLGGLVLASKRKKLSA